MLVIFLSNFLLSYISVYLLNMVKISEVNAVHLLLLWQKNYASLSQPVGCFLNIDDCNEVIDFLPPSYQTDNYSGFHVYDYWLIRNSNQLYCVTWKQIKDLMQDFSSKHIIPHMEQKIRVLNQQVVPLAFSAGFLIWKEYSVFNHEFVCALLSSFISFLA